MMKLFDLNIEEVLENWEVEHALREIIANALDEQFLSNTSKIVIRKDASGDWHIRDFGRGLRIEHFTLNENVEKLSQQQGVIGKFGVGLKDALATLFRNKVTLLIVSPYGRFYLRQSAKHNFHGIQTLHVGYDDAPQDIQGTDFIVRGIDDKKMALAKAMFLEFSNEIELDTTHYGQILQRKGDIARVYIQGVLASEEPNFLFSYNITNLTPGMRKRLNRERINVGRATYSDRIKSIIKSTNDERVKRFLVDEVLQRAKGDQCDEMQWSDISQLALTWMHERSRVAYFTETELQSAPHVVDNARADGYQPIVITDSQKERLVQQATAGGPSVRTVEKFVEEFNNSFQYKFVDPDKLTPNERAIFDLTHQIAQLVRCPPHMVPHVKISENIRIHDGATEGVWDPAIHSIVIRRNQLESVEKYAGTLLHELAHATTGASDVSRRFEGVLTIFMGRIAASMLDASPTSRLAKKASSQRTLIDLFRRKRN